jgi:ABC-type Fe3+-citrate transport system substrate-binding protein
MKIKLLITLILTLVLLDGCGGRGQHPMDMSEAVQNADTKAEHEALAEHYEEEAAEMKVKLEEHKKLLAQYQAKSYLYGRQAEDFKAHCEGLINADEKAVEANLSMAKIHRMLSH